METLHIVWSRFTVNPAPSSLTPEQVLNAAYVNVGQGANCGFEDVRLLQESLVQHPASLDLALKAYSENRVGPLNAIQHFSLQNYHEMASKTVDPLFMLRKRLDAVLTRLLGEDVWCSLYTMVSFRADLPYDKALRREARQRQIINAGLVASAAALLGGAATFTARRWR